jgi:hypothetical protein
MYTAVSVAGLNGVGRSVQVAPSSFETKRDAVRVLPPSGKTIWWNAET